MSAISKSEVRCRLCNQDFSLSQSGCLFRIDRAPRSAQHLPSAEDFHQDDMSAPLELFQCPSCGHYQLFCQPVKYWKEVLTAAGLSAEMRNFRKEQFANWVDQYKLRGKEIMEIGCGEGQFLDLLSEAGVIAFGLEAGTNQVQRGQQAGREIQQGHPLDPGCLSPSTLDGFLCINFLEHATNPIDLLRSIFLACKPDAVGIVEVPNFQKDIDEQKSYNLIKDHLSYFTARTLSVAVGLSGFELLSIREVWHGDDIEAIVRVPYPTPCIKWASGTPIVRGLSNLLDMEKGRVAIWGASHQALTLIGIIRPNNVICIADSAEFKQGKVDPVCGIPIVSPDDMIASHPDLVIIIAASYSKEVARLLGENKRYSGRTIILEEVLDFA